MSQKLDQIENQNSVKTQKRVFGGAHRVIEFGFSYLPMIDMVEDFSPFWIDDKWTKDKMKEDLMVMRSLGCRCLRYHMMPANPERDRFPGVNPDKYLKLINYGVDLALQLGLKVHLDIDSHTHDFQCITKEDISKYVKIFKGRIESYQIGNELYSAWKDDNNIKKLGVILETGKKIDQKAKFSIDITAPGMNYMRDKFLYIYNLIDMILIHYYSATDYRGWNEMYMEDLVRFSEGDDRDFKKVKDKSYYSHGLYRESYGSHRKEKWITEITQGGYFRWAGLVTEDKKARDWEQLVTKIAEKTDITRIYHHCFGDKMSWREFGYGQAGLTYIGAVPKKSASKFKELAIKYMPDEDPMKNVYLNIPQVNTGKNKNNFLILNIQNNSHAAINNTIKLYAPKEVRLKQGKINFSVNAHEHKGLKINFHASRFSKSNNHIFASYGFGDKTNIGLGMVVNYRAINIKTHYNIFKGVHYIGGMNPLKVFLKRHSPSLGIIVGGGIGFMDSEMGYRMKLIIQALTGHIVELRHSVIASDILDRPLILIGNPSTNIYCRVMEMNLPPHKKVSERNKCFIAVVKSPFGSGRFDLQTRYVGYHKCHQALYIAGLRDEDIKIATYDLIKRIWRDRDVAEGISWIDSSYMCDYKKKIFRIDLLPGAYEFLVSVGNYSNKKYYTSITVNNKSYLTTCMTQREVKEYKFAVNISAAKKVDFLFDTIDNFQWSLIKMEIYSQDLLAEHKKFKFISSTKGINIPNMYGGYELVKPITMYDSKRKYGWTF